MAKDLFSKQSDLYAKYRPTYPAELFEYILSFVNERELAWDCATGNGQAAVILAKYFTKVIGTDISAAQIEHAKQEVNIEYLVCPAESTSFPNDQFDLITVAQAYHWLRWDAFREEAIRVAKPGCIIAVWAYGGHQIEPKIKNIVSDFYENVVGSYWEKERKHIDDGFKNVAFNYELLPTKDFEITVNWNRKQWLGYISTWSALQKYEKVIGYSALPLLEEKVRDIWPEEEIKTVKFHVFLKLGKIIK